MERTEYKGPERRSQPKSTYQGPERRNSLDWPFKPLTDEQRVHLQAEFAHERTEMFFASAVVLVEGQTEQIALPLVFRRLGHHPDALGISVVEVGGKGNIPLVARLLAELGIPHVVVFDSDRGRPGERENRLIKRAVGKLDAPADMAERLREVGVRPLPVSLEHAAHVQMLPMHHRDPFDRLLVAQAAIEGATLLSRDAQLAAYDVPVLW